MKTILEMLRMNEEALSILLCPYCKKGLVKEKGSLNCLKCNNRFKIIDGIIYLKKIGDFYYSEYSTSTDKQKILIRDLRNVKNLSMLIKIIESKYKEIYQYVFSPSRCDFLYLLPHFVTEINARFLEIGCGFGNALIFKKNDAQYLYGIEPVYERLFVLRKIIELEQIDSIIPILGDSNDLPFYNNIDVILLNGVLEWAGYYESKETPKEVINSQLIMLKNCYSALKNNGVLVIAIENRFAPYFLRFPDHGGSYFTSFLPRKISNLITKALYKRPYNTYTYDYFGYEKLLRKIGFKNIRIYGCWPIYRKPRIIYNLENANAIKSVLTLNLPKTRIGTAYFKTVSKSLTLARILANSYIIFAFKNGAKLLGDILYSGSGLSVKIFDLKSRTVMNKIRQKSYAKNILKSIKNIYEERKVFSPRLKYINYDKRVYIEEIIYGKRANLSNVESIAELFEYMCSIYKKHAQSITVGKYIKKIRKELHINRETQEKKSLINQVDIITHYLDEEHKNEKIIITEAHGDFHLGNILIRKEGKKPVLLDWEASRTSSLLYDYFTLWALAHFTGLVNLRNIIKNFPRTKSEQFAVNLINYFRNIDNEIGRKISLYFSTFMLELISYKLALLLAVPYLRESIIKELQRWIHLWGYVFD